MVGAEQVAVERATAADAPLLSNLLDLYVHDLSEVFPIEIGVDGRFGYEKLPLYFAGSERHLPFLIRSGNRVAGFALVTRGSPATDDPDDLDMAEFFVLRGHRRRGVGRRAAPLLWSRMPGHWIVRVSEGNRAGLPFWESVIREHTSGVFSRRSRPGNPHPWRVYSFDSASPGATA